MISVNVDISAAKKAITNIIDRTKRSKDAYTIISVKMRKEVLNHFAEEMGPDNPWVRSYRATSETGKTLQDTKTLLSSIKARADDDGAEVYTNVPYAGYNQYGKGRMNRPFMWIPNEVVKYLAVLYARYVETGRLTR